MTKKVHWIGCRSASNFVIGRQIQRQRKADRPRTHNVSEVRLNDILHVIWHLPPKYPCLVTLYLDQQLFDIFAFRVWLEEMPFVVSIRTV